MFSWKYKSNSSQISGIIFRYRQKESGRLYIIGAKSQGGDFEYASGTYKKNYDVEIDEFSNVATGKSLKAYLILKSVLQDVNGITFYCQVEAEKLYQTNTFLEVISRSCFHFFTLYN